MKFLVLAICVYAASAAVPTFRRGQPWQFATKAAQATVPEVQTVTKSIVQVQTQPAVVQPAVVAKTVLTDNRDVNAPILNAVSEINEQGFNNAFETGNGISASSVGTLKKVDKAEFVVIQGVYRYTAPDGTPVEVTYTADENGYQPKSNLLPVGPPTPEAILRSLQYIAEHPQSIETVKNL